MIATILTGILLFAALGLAGQNNGGMWWLAVFGPLWAALREWERRRRA